MADRYWVGGTGTWSDTAHWSATSGGAGGAGVPVAGDVVIFDSASAAASYVVTWAGIAINVASLTITAPATGVLSFSGAAGGVTITGAGLSIAASSVSGVVSSGGVTFIAPTGGTLVVNTNNVNIIGGVKHQGAGTIRYDSSFTASNGTFNFDNASISSGTTTVNLNSKVFSVFQVAAVGSGTVIVNMAASSLTTSVASTGRAWEISNPNLTFNAGASSITIGQLSNNQGFYGGGRTYATVTFQNYSNTIYGSNTFGTLELITGGYQNETRCYTIADDQTIGTLTLSGGSSTRKMGLVGAKLGGVTLNVTTQGNTPSFWDFANIKITGITLSGSDFGNGGGNSGISGYSAPKTVYMVGGSYMDASWATTSGGVGSVSNIPKPQDTIIINDVFPASGGTLYSYLSSYGAMRWPKIDASARTLPFTWYPSGSGLYLCRDATIPSVISFSSTVYVDSDTPVALNLGGSRTFGIQIGAQNPSTYLDLSGALTTSGTLTVTSGTLDTNGYACTLGTLRANSTNTRTLTFGSSLVTLTGTSSFDIANPGTLTINAGTSTIRMSSASAKTFNGLGYTYYNLDQGGAGALTITGANTFNDVQCSYHTAASTIKFPAATTTTLANLTASGVAGFLVTLTSSTGTSQATLSKASGTVSLSYANISWLNGTGGATWNALTNNGCVNGGNNTNWTISSTITLAAAAAVNAATTAALSKTSRLASITSVAASATAALVKQIKLSFGPYAVDDYVADDYYVHVGARVSATARLANTLRAEATVSVSTTASLSKAASIAAVATSTSTSTASLGVTKGFASSVQAVASATGAIARTANMAASVTCTSTAAASLNRVATLADLASTGAVTNVLSAALAISKPIAGSGSAVVTSTASLGRLPNLTSSVACVSSATGIVTKAARMAVTALVSVSGTASAAVTKPFAASATASTTATSALGKSLNLTSTVQSATTVTGYVNKSLNLTGTLVSVSTATAATSLTKPFAANVTMTSTSAASLNRVATLADLASTGAVTNVMAANLGVTKVFTATGTVLTVINGGLSIDKPLQGTGQVDVTSDAQLQIDATLGALEGQGAVTNVITALMQVGKPLASSGLVLAAAYGRIVYTHPNQLEGIGVTSADVQVQALFAEYTTIYPQVEVIEREIFASVADAQLYMTTTYELLYADAELVELSADAEASGLFLYRKAA